MQAVKEQSNSIQAGAGSCPSGGPGRSSASVTVSVVIVSWNAKDYLIDCLNSLSGKACSYPMEIIVVDNASSDGSAEIVRDRYPQVRLIRNGANLGFAKANNIGIQQSSGKYVCLVNSDVKHHDVG
jgi:hypothetical protein